MRNLQPAVYIMGSVGGTIYIGVTSDLWTRVWQHKNPESPKAFTAKYKCHKLIYFEEFARMDEAIAFEKFLKGKTRDYKLALIRKKNARWNDFAWNWYD